MKIQYTRFFFTAFCIAFFLNFNTHAQLLKGSWKSENESFTISILATDDYFSLSKYDKASKKFIETFGGKYTLGGSDDIYIDIDYHSSDVSVVGSNQSYNCNLKKKSLQFNDFKFNKLVYKHKDDLQGLWRITERADTLGKMVEMPKTSRKTYKIIVDGGFQWIAVDTKTAEFFGTGGGQYKLINDEYIEEIEYFSRDGNRVGSKLGFKYNVESGRWTHSGKSSKGLPIIEIWTLQNN